MGDVGEDAMVATLLETREFMIAQLAAEVARERENHPVCEEHDGLDSPEYVDVFDDDTLEKALDPAGVEAADLVFMESAGLWQVVLQKSLELGDSIIKGRWVDTNKGDEVSKNYRYVVKEIRRGAKRSLVAEFFAAMLPPKVCWWDRWNSFKAEGRRATSTTPTNS